MKSRLCLLVIVAVGLTSVLTGCSRDPNVRKQKYYESGQRYFSQGKYREAAIQFRNAVQVDETFAAAHYQLAQSYLKLQEWQHAYAEAARTVELEPDNYKAHADIANMLLADYANTSNASDLTQAKEHTDLLLEKQPNDPDSHIVAANVLGADGKYSEAIAEAQKAITLAPDRGNSYLALALFQMKAGQFDDAEANFKKAIQLNAASDPHMALAAFYEERGRYPEAEQQIESVIAANPKDVNARSSLAKLYITEGKQAQAEQFLAQVKRDLPDDPVAYRMLGDLYVNEGAIDKALAEYDSLHQEHPKDVQVSKNYVQLLISKNRLDDAEKLNESLLSSKAKDDEALTLRGEIQMKRGKLAEAVQTLQAVVAKNLDMATAHYQLGMALAEQGQLDRAGNEWQQAVRLQPNMVDADRALAELSLRRRDMAALEQYSSEVIRLQPSSPDGYAYRAISSMARKRFPTAEADAHKAIEVAPQEAVGYIEMANIEAAQEKSSEAAKWYEQALTHDAGSIDALGGLTNIYLLQKQPDKAIERINAQIKISPNNSAFYDLLGSVRFKTKDTKGAEVALKKAVELDKNNTDAYVKLGQTQAKEGQLDEALATCAAGASANPGQAEFYVLSGEIYEKQRDFEKAKAAYQTALQIRPGDPGTSNNLAYVLLESNGNVDTALQLAQSARRSMPESSTVADTLGWAFYQKGVYESAIGMFEEAIKLATKNKEAENPTYHYHLGLAYAKTDKRGLARQHLERALKIDPNYRSADDIRKELAQLKS